MFTNRFLASVLGFDKQRLGTSIPNFDPERQKHTRRFYLDLLYLSLFSYIIYHVIYDGVWKTSKRDCLICLTNETNTEYDFWRTGHRNKSFGPFTVTPYGVSRGKGMKKNISWNSPFIFYLYKNLLILSTRARTKRRVYTQYTHKYRTTQFRMFVTRDIIIKYVCTWRPLNLHNNR